jgi:hypothetical protein
MCRRAQLQWIEAAGSIEIAADEREVHTWGRISHAQAQSSRPKTALLVVLRSQIRLWPFQCYFNDSVQKRKARYENKIAFHAVLNRKFWYATPQKAVSVRVISKIARQAASLWAKQVSSSGLMDNV